MRQIVPLADRRPRLPEMGKLKFGDQTEITSGANKGKPRARVLDTWRIMSANRDALERLAERYGGKIIKSRNSKAHHPFELTTESDVLDVLLPPDPLGDTPIYEKFGPKGLERQCDGERCQRTTIDPADDGGLMVDEVPCICFPLIEKANATGGTVRRTDVCAQTTRLSVMFADIEFGGVWTMLTHSELAGDELPGMVALIQQQVGTGLAHAKLRISKRSSRGGTKKFNVPVLHPAASLNEMMAGAGVLTPASAGQLVAPTYAELPAAVTEEDVVDAVVVDRRAELRAQTTALKERAEADPDGESWVAWETLLREISEYGWPSIKEMTDMQLDAYERLLIEVTR